jgi:hypothetical protein
MADPHALPQQVEQALARGWTVLTANQRAARTLRHAYDLSHQAGGLPNWQPPSILAWDTWLAGLWRRLLLEGHASALLLNPTQEHTLWRAVIQADRQSAASLRPLDSLAELAASAWSLLHAYRGRHRLHATASTTDTRAFSRWANEFDRRATRLNYLTAAQLPEALRTAIAAGQLVTVPSLLLLGFDTQTPTQLALLESLQTTGTEVEDLGAPGSTASPSTLGSPRLDPLKSATHTQVAALDQQDELTTCARWLRTRLTANPTERLAVIVPALETARTEIDRIFRHILAPELEDIAAPAAHGPFERAPALAPLRTRASRSRSGIPRPRRVRRFCPAPQVPPPTRDRTRRSLHRRLEPELLAPPSGSPHSPPNPPRVRPQPESHGQGTHLRRMGHNHLRPPRSRRLGLQQPRQQRRVPDPPPLGVRPRRTSDARFRSQHRLLHNRTRGPPAHRRANPLRPRIPSRAHPNHGPTRIRGFHL